MQWTTYYGRQIDMSQLSHQHLSNILYYFELVLEMQPSLNIIKELDERFGGIRLPYHPQVSFNYEMDVLRKKGYTSGQLDADIVVNGRWIGKIKYN